MSTEQVPLGFTRTETAEKERREVEKFFINLVQN